MGMPTKREWTIEVPAPVEEPVVMPAPNPAPTRPEPEPGEVPA